jgi:CRP-like cAMP-binding protein
MPDSRFAAISSEVSSRFFQGIGPSDVRAILAAASPRQYLAGSVIVSQGTPADHLYLLSRGRARYFFLTPDGKKISLIWILPGEMLGGAAFLSEPKEYLVSTEAVTDSRVLAWERGVIRHLGTRCPRLMENALLIASNYLAWYVADHAALISKNARQRLARVLICLAETIGRKVREGSEIDATNEELASAANITPFTASRLLAEWQRNRAVVKRRGKLLLRSPGRLFMSAT